MSEDNKDKSKVFDPTPRKIQEARKKGQIPLSKELLVFGAYLGFFVSLYLVYYKKDLIFSLMVSPFMAIHQLNGVNNYSLFLNQLFLKLLGQFVLFLLPLVVFTIALVALQNAFVFSPERIKIKFNKINILKNFRQKLGKKNLFDFLKGLVKITVLFFILFYFVFKDPVFLVNLPQTPIEYLFSFIYDKIYSIIFISLLLTLSIGGVDYLFQYNDWFNNLKMTYEEMRKEMKESEGDPEQKQRRRQKAIEIATSKMLTEVPTADVVIVNPEHYAVALKWNRHKAEAPRCIAKGIDSIALTIKSIAKEHNIAIKEDPPLARALHKELKIGQEIPEAYYHAVAIAIHYAESLRQQNQEVVHGK